MSTAALTETPGRTETTPRAIEIMVFPGLALS
jgi:hypothetical protein